MKTVTFAQVLAKSGKPEIHLSWTPPEKDRALMAAVKQQRVMSLHQTIRGSTKDYGTVGLLKSPGTQLLVFPKSLRSFSDRRVIAINYDLLHKSPLVPAKGDHFPKARSKEKRTSSTKPRADIITFPEEEEKTPAEEKELPQKRTTLAVESRNRKRLTWKALVPELEAIEKKLRAGQTEEASSLLADVIADAYATAKPKGSRP